MKKFMGSTLLLLLILCLPTVSPSEQALDPRSGATANDPSSAGSAVQVAQLKPLNDVRAPQRFFLVQMNIIYDGNDYRLRLARFERDEWSAVETLGERGSLSAGFIESGEGVSLLFQTAMPASWTVLELDRRGRRLRQAVVPSASNERPLLVPDETGPARLYWPEAPGRQAAAVEHALEWQELP